MKCYKLVNFMMFIGGETITTVIASSCPIQTVQSTLENTQFAASPLGVYPGTGLTMKFGFGVTALANRSL